MSGYKSDHLSNERSPDFVIIGAAKSATTWLHLALRRHPQVAMPHQETPFLEDPLYAKEQLNALTRALPIALTSMRLGIKNPNYFTVPECAPRLAKHLPSAKLVVLLRNPIDRAISAHYHLMRAGRFPIVDAGTAFSYYLAGKFSPPSAKWMVLEGGNYASAYKNYRNFFPAQQILCVTDLEIQANTEAAFARICQFIGVRENWFSSKMRVPRNRGIYSMPLLILIGYLNRLRYSYSDKSGTFTNRPGRLAALASIGVRLSQRLSTVSRLVVPTRRPPISEFIRAGVLDYYLPEIEEFESLTGVDLRQWKEISVCR